MSLLCAHLAQFAPVSIRLSARLDGRGLDAVMGVQTNTSWSFLYLTRNLLNYSLP